MFSRPLARTVYFFAIFFAIPILAGAQVVPLEHRILNARIVGCAIPAVKGVDNYTIRVSRGSYIDNDIFEKNLIIIRKAAKSRFVVDLPEFGVQYTWRIDAGTTRGALHHFSTGIAPEVNPDSFRLRVTVPSGSKSEQYVFVDGARVLYDLDGNVIWFLPGLDSIPRTQEVRDMKMSPWSSITFMVNEQAWELGYDGNVRWREPQAVLRKGMTMNDRLSYFHHHTFTHLSNGRYITLGMERALWELPGKVTKTKHRLRTRILVDRNGVAKQQLFANKVQMFDTGHVLVWAWSFADYLKASDVHERHRRNGLFVVGGNGENDCYLHESSKTLYVSINSISRIVKLHYPDGKVLNTYGARYIPGNLELANDLFCGQHGPRLSQDGLLYFFNNNTCNRLCNGWPSILMVQEPQKQGLPLRKVWEYQCLPDSMEKNEEAQLKFDKGGCVQELSDRSLFCCMGGNYGKVFIVGRDKTVLWSALPEKWDHAAQAWRPRSSYRASIITRKELESLIWNEPLKK